MLTRCLACYCFGGAPESAGGVAVLSAGGGVVVESGEAGGVLLSAGGVAELSAGGGSVDWSAGGVVVEGVVLSCLEQAVASNTVAAKLRNKALRFIWITSLICTNLPPRGVAEG